MYMIIVVIILYVSVGTFGKPFTLLNPYYACSYILISELSEGIQAVSSANAKEYIIIKYTSTLLAYKGLLKLMQLTTRPF